MIKRYNGVVPSLFFYCKLVHLSIALLRFRALFAAPAEAGGSIYFL
ncbi:protein of unknown function [Xenorhabdus nematophila AN6/1]|nr:protein of unknown function [Xenorhabdus nematophila AN6/1]